jgi:FkbM family methyltransferase
MVNRGYCNHAGIDAELFKLLDRFRNKAAAHLILVRRKKWGQRQNVQTINALSIILKPVQDTPSIVNAAMLIELQTQARSLLRRFGLVPLLDRVRSVWRAGYEDAFSRSLLEEIRSHDCVWDVGANVGYYSQRMALLASRLSAFEPVPETFSRLSKLSLPNATFVNLALGDTSGVLPMSLANDASSLAVLNSNIAEVQVARGDDLDLPPPNIVKIDVEGFEYEVISGMQTTLSAAECRAVFCELHFEVLEKRGLRQNPAKIVKRLRSLGFTKITWLDASHISAHKS